MVEFVAANSKLLETMIPASVWPTDNSDFEPPLRILQVMLGGGKPDALHVRQSGSDLWS